MPIFELEEQDHLMVAHELDVRHVKRREETEVEARGLVAIVLSGSVVLEERSTILDDALGGLETR